jgi:hypothetical protein
VLQLERLLCSLLLLPLSVLLTNHRLPCLPHIAVPALAGRTALQAYTDFMAAFRDAFSELLGSVVTDADIGLGPRGEYRYPSTPLDSRWNFPGIGEFQVRMASLQIIKLVVYVPTDAAVAWFISQWQQQRCNCPAYIRRQQQGLLPAY